MTDNNQQTIEKRPYYGGGRNKLSPEEKKVSVKKSKQKFRAATTNFSAEIENKSFKLAKQMQDYLGLSTNAQLLDWLLEKGRRSISRSNGSDPFKD